MNSKFLKNLNQFKISLSIKLVLLFSVFFHALFYQITFGQSQLSLKPESYKSLPPGDYILNEKNGQFEPFFSNDKKSDFVKESGCNNRPGIEKNFDQLGRFIPTAIMGNDDRCELIKRSDAPESEKAFYGVGELFDFSRKCDGDGSRSSPACSGTAHLVMDQDIVVTSAHVFLDDRTHVYSNGEGFKFSTKVWIPPELRKDPTVEYEYRSYEIEKVFIKMKSFDDIQAHDYAFVKLKEPVGVRVGKKLENGKYGPLVTVDSKHLIKPLPYKIINENRFLRNAQMVGLQIDKKGYYKQCSPFRLYSDLSVKGLLFHDGDMVSKSSGSAIVIPDEQGVYTFTGINIADSLQKGQDQFDHLPYDYPHRYNILIDGNEIYNDFMMFRNQFHRTSTKPM